VRADTRKRGGILLGILAVAILVAVAVGSALGSSNDSTTIDSGPAKARIAGRATVGTPAPAFDLPRLTGPGRVSLASLRGRPVIVNFWASWCGPCREEFPQFHQLAAERAGSDLAIVGITFRDIPSDARGFARDHGGTWTFVKGGDEDPVARAYGVRSPPQTFFIDRRGVIRARAYGPPSKAALDAEVTRISRKV
jgi:cytochrome c biogenesis protein CcmG/thiol:disulfide interchange protein DsbE